MNELLNDALAGISKRRLLAYAEHLAAGNVPTAAALREAAAPERLAEPAAAKAPAGGIFWQHYDEWVAYTRAAQPRPTPPAGTYASFRRPTGTPSISRR